MDRLESVLNFVCPKSIIVYGQKCAAAATSLDETTRRANRIETTAAAA
jgi:hypothetical protein